MSAPEFQQHGVVPDTLPSPPPSICNIQYGSGNHVNLGNVLSIASTQTTPTLHFPSEVGVHYTIMMVDPDALSRATHEYRHFCHWVLVNVSGTGGAYLDLSKSSHAVCEYIGPAPPPGTGYHRYITLVYKQHAALDVKNVKSFGSSPSERKSFNPQQWLSSTFSQAPPQLIAANFFLAGTEDESMSHMAKQNEAKENNKQKDDGKDKGKDSKKDEAK